jgi:hypothetical protein
MSIENFSIISAMNTLGPLARANLFYFEINSVPGGAGGNSSEDIRFAAESASVPKSSNTPMVVPWMNSDYKIPGVTAWDNISVALRVSEANGMRIYDTLNNWYKMIYNPDNGVQQVPATTMATAKISLLNYQGEVTKYWDVYKLFPTSVGGTPLDRGNAEKQIVTIEFAYTYAKLGGGSSPLSR